MTPMIRTTHSDELVELRAGDVVHVRGSHHKHGTVVSIDEHETIRVKLSETLHWNGGAEDLTLQFRPIKKDDPIEWYALGSKQWLKGNASGAVLENIEENALGLYYRHTNPLLRPAKGYGG